MHGEDQSIAYDASPAAVSFADTADGEAANARAAAAIGGRIAASATIDRAIERLDTAVVVDVALVDLRAAPTAASDRLLDRLDLAARNDRHASVVRIAPELIDAVVARVPHADVQIVVGDDAGEAAAALGIALARRRRPAPYLAEREGEPLQLRQLSEEVSRIAQALARLSGFGEPRMTAHVLPVETDEAWAPPVTAAAVRTLIRARRLREQYFDPLLFADPAWDMLLDLMAARLEGRQVAVSSLCIAAAVPPTTALRWMKQLVDDGLLLRVADPRDGRRVFIVLAEAAAEGLAAYLQAVGRIGVVVA